MEKSGSENQDPADFISNALKGEIAEEETAPFLQTFNELYSTIRKQLLACENPELVSTSLNNLGALCNSKKWIPLNIEIKAAAKVARDLAKVEAQSAAVCANHYQFFYPDQHAEAVRVAEQYKAVYLNAAINKGHVITFDKLNNNQDSDEEEEAKDNKN